MSKIKIGAEITYQGKKYTVQWINRDGVLLVGESGKITIPLNKAEKLQIGDTNG